jgi:thioredoxin reductase (NADPH)
MVRETEVVIVGAGPIGIEMAAALSRHGIPYAHYEAGSIGWTIGWFAPDTTFFSSPERIALSGVPLQILGQRKATREEYLNYLRSVVQQFGLSIQTYRKVTSVQRQVDGSLMVSTERSSHGIGGPPVRERLQPGVEPMKTKARCVVFAIGDMHRSNLLGVPGESLPHVSHFLAEPHTYFGKRVVIYGGKNSAAEAALRLYRVGAHVSLVYRGPELSKEKIKYWIYPELVSLINEGKIDFYPSTTVTAISPQTVRLCTSNKESEVAADFVLLLVGYGQDPSLYQHAGVQLEGPGLKPCYDPDTMETSVPGIFVAGTGSAGSQLGGCKEFIETSHVHVDKILAKILGRPAPSTEPLREVECRES